MNKLINKIVALSLVLFMVGCSDEAIGPILQSENLKAPIITAPTASTSFTMQEATLANSFADFTWSEAEYGFAAGTKYTLEMDLAANNFSDPIPLGNTSNATLGVKNSQVNAILLAKGAIDKVPTDVAFRLVAKISDEVDLLYSDVLTLKVAAVKVKVDYPKLMVPGSYQGWDPAKPSTVIFSVKSDKKFEGFLYFPDPNAEFKFTEGPNWDVNYGDTGADGTLDRNGDNIRTTDAGMYKMNVNLNALTFTYSPANFGVIGNGTPTGWDSDTDMIYDATSNTLKVTLPLTDGGEIKFRANDGWDLNFGDTNANGSLEYGGDNIKVPAGGGTFEIELILNTGDYTYKLTKK